MIILLDKKIYIKVEIPISFNSKMTLETIINVLLCLILAVNLIHVIEFATSRNDNNCFAFTVLEYKIENYSVIVIMFYLDGNYTYPITAMIHNTYFSML